MKMDFKHLADEILTIDAYAKKISNKHKIIVKDVILILEVPKTLQYLARSLEIPVHQGKLVLMANDQEELDVIKIKLEQLYTLKNDHTTLKGIKKK